MNVVYHEFCNWKTILCEKMKLLSNIYENSQENTLQESIFLMKLHTSLFLEYFQMFPFETTSIKACKLYIVCIICSSQQIRWLRGWNGRWASLSAHRRKKDNVCILGKKLHFFYLIIVLREWNQACFELFNKIFLAFQCGVGCEFAISMAYKERYNWSMNCVLLDRKLLDFIS